MSDLRDWRSQELVKMKSDLDHLFEELCSDFGLPTVFGACLSEPEVQITEDVEAVYVEIELHGVKVNDIELTVGNGFLIFKLTRKKQLKKGKQVDVLESRIRLPRRIIADLADAEMTDATLKIRLPKYMPAVERRVRIRVR